MGLEALPWGPWWTQGKLLGGGQRACRSLCPDRSWMSPPEREWGALGPGVFGVSELLEESAAGI